MPAEDHPKRRHNPPLTHGVWQINSSRMAYRDPWASVRRDEVTRPDGNPGSYVVVHLKPGVCVIPIWDNGDVQLTQEFHYGVGRVTLEGVSGGIDVDQLIDAGVTLPSDDETLSAPPGAIDVQQTEFRMAARATAHKELREELGLTAKQLSVIGTVDPFTANVVSPTQLFVARGLSQGESSQEGTECITAVRMHIDDAIQKVRRGEITHAPTVVALLTLALDGNGD